MAAARAIAADCGGHSAALILSASARMRVLEEERHPRVLGLGFAGALVRWCRGAERARAR